MCQPNEQDATPLDCQTHISTKYSFYELFDNYCNFFLSTVYDHI